MDARVVSIFFLGCTFFTWALSTVDTQAGDCGFLKRDPLSLRDTELFYHEAETNEWRSADTGLPTTRGQVTSFAYVIRERPEDLAGAVVVKSGRKQRVGEKIAPKLVTLVRERPEPNADGKPFDNGRCGPIPEFRSTSVSTESYDAYHDLGYTITGRDGDALKRFHYYYNGRSGCRQTDNSDDDSRIPPVKRTRRGQFSFDTHIVAANSPRKQWISWLAPESAAAGGSDGLAEQRVEIQAYRLKTGYPTCVRFSFAMPDATAFIRVNDLDAFKRQGNYLIRADEKAWGIAP